MRRTKGLEDSTQPTLLILEITGLDVNEVIKVINYNFPQTTNHNKKGPFKGAFYYDIVSNGTNARAREADTPICSSISFTKFLEMFPIEWQQDDVIKEKVRDFFIHRKEIKKILTGQAARGVANKLSKHSIEVAIEAIQRSINNKWTDVFPESVKIEEDEIIIPSKETLHKWFTKWKFSLPRATMMNFRDSSKEHERIKARRWYTIPSATTLITKYEEWLDKQTWITDKTASHIYDPTKKVFQRFLNKYQGELHVNFQNGSTYKP